MDTNLTFKPVGNGLRAVPRAAERAKLAIHGTPRWAFPAVRMHCSAIRSGLSVFELTVALFVLTTAMMAIVQLLGVAASQRRTIEQRRAAQAEVANQAERIALLPWDEVSSDKLKSWELSDESRTSLKHG